MNSKVLVIIPAYNESTNIVKTVQSVSDCGYDYVVINDGSTDNTIDVCLEHHINVIDLPQNLGIGGAVQAGHKYALKYGYDIDVQVDGDGQHDPTYIHDLIEEMEMSNSDLVIGSRFKVKTDGFQSTLMRRIGIMWFTFFLKLLTGKTVTDPTSGFRASGKKAIKLFSQHYPIDYPEPESIAYALSNGLSVGEVSVIMKERQGGVSSIGGFSSVYYMVKVTLSVAISWFSSHSK